MDFPAFLFLRVNAAKAKNVSAQKSNVALKSIAVVKAIVARVMTATAGTIAIAKSRSTKAKGASSDVPFPMIQTISY